MKVENGRDGPDVRAVYDALAAGYDAALLPAQWIRRRLWDRLDALFPAGSRVLDVSAGTGEDAVHLAGRGVQVVACDLSPKMLAELHRKAPEIETRAVDFADLAAAFPGAAFDGVISTFAGLNTAPDLGRFAGGAAGLLRPGGVLLMHILNRWPALDIIRKCARGKWQEAWRACTSSARLVHLQGAPVILYLFSPRDTYRRWFAREFQLTRLSAQGIVRPVGTRWGRSLDGLDAALARLFPFNRLGTFCCLEMVRK